MPDSTVETRQLKSRAGYLITVSLDELCAYMTIIPKKLDGEQVTKDNILNALKEAGIEHGILENNIEDLISEEAYGKKVLVAEGIPQETGKDAEIEYLFNTAIKKSPREDSEGRIDYKDLDYILNTSAGDLLVRKTPPEDGTLGKSVFGEELEGLVGEDKKIPVGKNTCLSEDGLELHAEVDGSIVLAGAVVNIHTISTITGDVDSGTGNIECNGSLKVTKAVKSGFTVRVKGNLEINGHIEDATIICDGNVIVKAGFFGGGNGKITAKGDVTVKWVEGQTIHCGGTLTIGGEALNCKLFGRESVIVKGSKGKIVGGEVASRYLIRAPMFGSDGGAKTYLKVAYDPELINKLKEIKTELERINDDGSRVKEGLTGLYKLELSGKLSPEKEAVLRKLEAFLKSIPDTVKELESRRDALQNQLREITNANILAEKKVFSGVKVSFGIVYKDILDTMGPTKFFIDYDTIIATKYNRSSEEL